MSLTQIPKKMTLGCMSVSGYEQGFEPCSPEERARRKAESYNAIVGNLQQVDGYECKLCLNKGFIEYVVPDPFVEGAWRTEACMCKCQRIRRAVQRLHKSGLENVARLYTMDSYQTNEPWQANLKAKAEGFMKDENAQWFFMGGQTGVGKTHLCTAIAIQAIRNGHDMRYMLWRDAVSALKAKLGDNKAYEDAISEWKTVEVLYIDDLFKSGNATNGGSAPTVTDVNIAYEILNYRYLQPKKQTIISSERTLGDIRKIDEAIAGRIAERSHGYCLNVSPDSEKNWRLKGVIEI